MNEFSTVTRYNTNSQKTPMFTVTNQSIKFEVIKTQNNFFLR